MQEFYQSINSVLYNMNSVVMLCIAAPLACIFVGFIIYDSYRRERFAKKHTSKLGRSSQNGLASSYRNLRSAYRTMEQDINRRRRMEEQRPRRRF